MKERERMERTSPSNVTYVIIKLQLIMVSLYTKDQLTKLTKTISSSILMTIHFIKIEIQNVLRLFVKRYVFSLIVKVIKKVHQKPPF